MKTLLAILLLAAAGYFYFDFKAAPAPRPHQFSEDNVFYLRRYVPVRTAKGIVGWVPGQQVKQCAGRVPGKIAVTDGWESMALSEDMLTHDMDEAAALMGSDLQSQRELLAQVDQAQHVAAARDAVLDAFTGDAINRENAYQMKVNAVGNFHSALELPPVASGSYGGSVFGWYPADASEYPVDEAAVYPQTVSTGSTMAPAVASEIAWPSSRAGLAEAEELLGALQQREDASARALSAFGQLDKSVHTPSPIEGFVRSIDGLKKQVEIADQN